VLWRSFASLALLSLALSACEAATPRAIDVVVITLDTTRADRLSLYGNDRDVSPSLEQFARDSVVFRRAWSVASWTLPAHASLLTGRYPSAHGAHNSPEFAPDSLGENPAHLREEAITLAELLVERGYRTAAFAGAGWLAPEFGLLQGYEVQDAENFRTLPADAITNRAIKWLEGVPSDEPVHLLVNYFDPHDPYAPPPGYDVFNPQNRSVRLPSFLSGLKPNAAQLARMLDLYDGEIRFMDQHLGRLFAALRENGRYDDALIIVTADHGELIGEHGLTGHGAWLWEELLRIPLVVHYPGGRGAGSESEELVSIVDLLPLIAKEVSLTLPDEVDGIALGERDFVLAEEFPNALFVKLGGPALDRDLFAGIRWPWKLIVSSRGDRSLYQLDGDFPELSSRDDGRVERDLARRIVETRAALERPAPAPGREMSPEAEQNLRELGYIE
jgi:arylsulfatase A-like enzyme